MRKLLSAAILLCAACGKDTDASVVFPPSPETIANASCEDIFVQQLDSIVCYRADSILAVAQEKNDLSIENDTSNPLIQLYEQECSKHGLLYNGGEILKAADSTTADEKIFCKIVRP